MVSGSMPAFTFWSVLSVGQIDDAHGVLPAIGGKPKSKVLPKGETMSTGDVGDFAFNLVVFDINHYDLVAVRNEEAMSHGVNREIVKASVPCDRNLFRKPVRSVLRNDKLRDEHCQQEHDVFHQSIPPKTSDLRSDCWILARLSARPELRAADLLFNRGSEGLIALSSVAGAMATHAALPRLANGAVGARPRAFQPWRAPLW
jgi:hypothetical protein